MYSVDTIYMLNLHLNMYTYSQDCKMKYAQHGWTLGFYVCQHG